MKLTNEQRSKLIEKLNSFGPAPECPICKSKTWSLSDSLFEIREFHEGGLKLGGGIIPLVPLTCTKCGNTNLLNAVILELIDPHKKEDQK
ncbi:MAG TPA: hypothetical protein P5295_17300 [Spirochaetota bacterium]|nr:hypothetical protein [Spirochaetota bacterium]